MKVLHLQLMGGPGGIVSLCRSINKVSSNQEYFYFIFDGGEVADLIEAEGGHVIVGHDAHFCILPGLNHFVNFCKMEKIDLLIVHANSPIAWIYAVVAKKKIKNLTLKTYVHADPTDFLKTGIKKKINLILFQASCKNSINVIAISQFIKKRTKSVVKFDYDKLIVLYNGILASNFMCIHDDTDKNRTFELIYIGRVTAFKNVKILPSVMSMLPQNVHLSIVGSGNELDAVKQLAETLNVSHQIDFLGNRLDIPQLLSRADLFIHPASWEEGFGITLVEAMAAGVPCIAYRKGAIPEIIHNNVNGWIVEKDTVEDFTNGIKFALKQYLNGTYSKYRQEAENTGKQFNMKTLLDNLERI